MDLRLEEVLLIGAGTAPTVTVKSDPGATVPSTVAALGECSDRWSLLTVRAPRSSWKTLNNNIIKSYRGSKPVVYPNTYVAATRDNDCFAKIKQRFENVAPPVSDV